MLLRFCFSTSKPFAQKVEVSESVHGTRLDKFLKEKYGIPWTQLQICLRKKDIFVQTKIEGQKKIRTPDYLLQTGDVVRIPSSWSDQMEQNSINKEEEEDESQIASENEVQQFKQMVIYEDKNIIFLNKENGVASQGGKDVETNLVSMGKKYIQKTNQDSAEKSKYLVAHRLDKVTSGILMIPKNEQVAKIYGHLFNEKTSISKQYLAVVQGIPKHMKGLINQPILYSSSKHKAILSGLQDDSSRSAHTHYQVIASFRIQNEQIITNIIRNQKDYIEQSNESHLALVKVRIEEGRKHQIRVHLSEVTNTPILGDTRYSCKLNYCKLLDYDSNKSIFLHCYQTQIKSNELAARLLRRGGTDINNEKGSLEVKDDIVEIEAALPPHFDALFKKGFQSENQQEEYLEFLHTIKNLKL